MTRRGMRLCPVRSVRPEAPGAHRGAVGARSEGPDLGGDAVVVGFELGNDLARPGLEEPLARFKGLVELVVGDGDTVHAEAGLPPGLDHDPHPALEEDQVAFAGYEGNDAFPLRCGRATT